MIITIENAVLYEVGENLIGSDVPLDIRDSGVNKYISSLIESTYDTNKLRRLEQARSEEICEDADRLITSDRFITFADTFAGNIQTYLEDSETQNKGCVIAAVCIINNVRFVVLLKVDYLDGILKISNSEDKGKVKLNLSSADFILPSGKKVNECVFVDMKNKAVLFKDKIYKDSVDHEKFWAMSDYVLEGGYFLSPLESATAILKRAAKIADVYNEDVNVIKSCLSEYINDNIGSDITISDLAAATFKNYPSARNDFKNRLIDIDAVPNELHIDVEIAKKLCSNIKIKTDTGAVIAIPAEHYSDDRFFKEKHNDDGSIEIIIRSARQLT